MLYEIMFGFQTADWQRALLAADPPALRQLQQLFLVRVIGRDRIEPTEAVLYSLDLDGKDG